MLVAILLAAGSSVRAGEDKVFSDLGGRPLLRWSADRLAADERIARVVIVARLEQARAAGEALRGLAKPYSLCWGGATRADSVRAGLAEARDADAVLVHDAARPFLDQGTLGRVLDGLAAHGAAAAALPVSDTLRRGDGWAGETIEREGLVSMQTPQAFSRAALADAYARASPPTDCAAAVVAAGGRVRLVRGDLLNFKITTSEDLLLAHALVDAGAVRR